jgi:hypothetical protein
VGLVEGYISYSDLPLPCQLITGYNQDGKVYDGTPIIDGLYPVPYQIE